MITWKGHWSEKATAGLSDIKIGEKMIQTYVDMPANLYQALCLTKLKYPEKTALINYDGKCYSYSCFGQMVDILAEALVRKYHICKGKHVGMLLYNGIEFCVTYLALCKLGAVVVSLPGKCQKPELLSLVEKADLDYLVCEEYYYEWFADKKEIIRILCENHEKGYGFEYLVSDISDTSFVLTENDLNDPVILMFTSGTTSQSKGVLLKNYNVMHAVEAYIRTLELTEKDTAIVATPMYHITGLVCILAVVLASGGKLHILKKVDPDLMLKSCLEHKVTYFHASPTVFAMLLAKSKDYPDIPSVTKFACGSGNMVPENIRRLKKWMPNAKFHTIFGMTETSGAGTIFPVGAADSEYIGASGVPMPNMEVKIVDELENKLPYGEVGEVCVKASFVLEAYYKSNSDSIKDGWLKTGDMGYCNEAGYLYIVDRKKDMINRGGEKICSFDVENKLQMMPGIVEAAVVGKPDKKYMEIPVAMVCVDKEYELTEEEIKAYLRERIAKYKVPEKVYFVPEIPKTVNGKVDKKTLRAQLSVE